jgi:septum formation protein
LDTPFVLASKSRIRHGLLAGAGIEVEVVPARVDERALEAGWAHAALSPDAVARALAIEKALAVARTMPGRIVIGADQTMALGNERFSKVETVAAAREKLLRLRGRTHRLHSGFAVARGTQVLAAEVLAADVSTAQLTMRHFSDAFLDRYLERAGEAILSSVGCYQLEGPGIALFDSVEGDYFTVLGLPLLPLLAALRAAHLIES